MQQHLHKMLEHLLATISSAICRLNLVRADNRSYNLDKSVSWVWRCFKILLPHWHNVTCFRPSKTHASAHSALQRKCMPTPTSAPKSSPSHTVWSSSKRLPRDELFLTLVSLLPLQTGRFQNEDRVHKTNKFSPFLSFTGFV
jgi:hypothetical protein